ncbi:MAG: hypothetical protein JXM71_00260, partial [Spirochaetales bacterium]|nr:hypothetical protein [Spirochaetales bacterium]
ALSSLTGAIAGQGINYALSGRAAFNVANLDVFGLTGTNGRLVSSGLLELGIGGDGLSLGIGSGGADMSISRVCGAVAGLETWGVNARLLLSGREDAVRYSSAMRTLYSADDAGGQERDLFERVVSGKLTIVEDAGGDYRARTEYDEATDSSVIHLGADALSDDSRFGLNVLLAHEAYRNGVLDQGMAQIEETKRAVLGHVKAADRLGSTYGSGALTREQFDEVYSLRAAASGGDQQQIANLLGKYDSSDDYWKLTKDGKLINDGRARLLAEITNDDGSTGWKLVEGSEKERSVAAALVHYLGEARALELFGGSVADVSLYDDQTLHDVLGLDYTDIKIIRHNPGEAESVIAMAGGVARDRLMGESIMKRAGVAWDGESADGAGAWLGTGAGISLTDGFLNGSAAIRQLGESAYERYSITTELERYEGAYDVWKDGQKSPVGTGNTRLSFTKWDVDSGEQIATIVADGAWNSVDNSYGQPDLAGNPIGADQPYKLPSGLALQGNTVARGPLNLRWSQHGSFAEWGDVLILSDTETISGERILPTGEGAMHQGGPRWLTHVTGYGSSDGCFVSVGAQPKDTMLTLLQTWGLYRGYSISGTLYDANDFVYGSAYGR